MLTVFQTLLIICMVIFGFASSSQEQKHRELIPFFIAFYSVSVGALLITFFLL